MRLQWLAYPVALLLAACAAAPQASPSPTPTTTLTFSPTGTPEATASPSPTIGSTSSPTGPPTDSPSVPPTASPSLPPPTPSPAPVGWLKPTAFPTYGSNTHVEAITFGGGQFVAVGWSRRNGNTRGRIWTSTDGRAWAAQPDAMFVDHTFQSVIHDGTDFYAFVSAPTSVWRSADGQAWQQVELPEDGGELGSFNVFTGGSVVDSSASGGQMFAAGEGGVIGGDIVCECASLWRSTDGTTWQQSTVVPPNYFTTFAVAGTPSFAVGIGDGSYIGRDVVYSSDFDTWNAPDLGLGEDVSWGFIDAAADASRVVAVGFRGDDFGEPIALLTDGTNWSVVPIDPTAQAPAEQVTWTGAGFVAIGTTAGGNGEVGLSWSSTDGVNWTKGPDVYDRPRDDPGPTPGDNPINYRAIGSGPVGVVLAQTFDDGLHVWFEPLSAFRP